MALVLLGSGLVPVPGAPPTPEAEAAVPATNGLIAFARFGGPPTQGIWTVRADGTGLRQVTTGFDAFPSWSPDGTRLAFSRRNPDGDIPEIWTVRADGTGATRITLDHSDTRPAWSPDGGTIAFNRTVPSGDFGLSTVAASGGAPTQRTPGSPRDLSPAWSPDGDRLSITTDRLLSGGGGGGFNLYLIDPDGTDPVSLERARALDTDWSPHGDHIAFHTDGGTMGVNELAVIGADGAGYRELGVRGEDASWSPDGRRLAYAAPRASDGTFTLHTVRTDGTGVQVVLPTLPGAAAYPAWQPVAPAAPSAVRVLGVDRGVRVRWAAVAPSTRVRAVASPGGRTCTSAPGARSCTISGLANGARYTVSVRAINAAGQSAWVAANRPVRPHPDPFPAAGFADVPRGTFFTLAVDWAAYFGITTGVDALRFAPGDPVTRAQMITFLWRLADEPRGAAPSGFVDVPRGVYFTAAVDWARATGVTTGVGGSNRFAPDDPVTRAQMVTLLHRAAGRPGGAAPSGFVDVPRGAFFTLAVDWARATGVTTGVAGSDRFAPLDPVTRAEGVTFMWRLARTGGAWSPATAAPSTVLFP